MPPSVKNINAAINSLPPNASVVAQNNITPHISHRKLIFTLYPTLKDFKENSPCGQPACNWLRWAGRPTYLIVDTSSDWDARSFLTERKNFVNGLQNMEKEGVIKIFFQKGDAYVYKIIKKP
jgi:hypothetical protein